MQYRVLGQTGISISAISFGAGPISQLLVGNDADRQRAVIQYAIERGINWFDTAATYGAGQSEQNLGRVLNELNAAQRVHVATKVRLMPEDLGDIGGADSPLRPKQPPAGAPAASDAAATAQFNHRRARRRADLDHAARRARSRRRGGNVRNVARRGPGTSFGANGHGPADALREVVGSGRFETMQVPYHLLNPTAGWEFRGRELETNYGNIISDSARQGMGVLAIRVFAGGALLGNPPSPHTHKTPFFPLALYQRDGQRAEQLKKVLSAGVPLPAAAIRFTLAHPFVHSALIGLGSVEEIDEALQALDGGASRINWDDVLAAPRCGVAPPPSHFGESP